MKGIGLALLISIAASLSCRPETDLLSVNVWDQYDSARASRSSADAIGTFVGKTVVHFNQKHRNVSLQPLVGPDIHGAQISLSW
jgi:hypothetical protein